MDIPAMQNGSMDSARERYAALVVNRRRTVIALVLVGSLLVGAGLFLFPPEFSVSQFEVDSPEQTAQNEIDAAFPTTQQPVSQIVVQSTDNQPDTVSKELLLETLTLQRDIRSTETVNETLATEQPSIGVANAIAIATDPRIGFGGAPPIESQISVLEDRTESQNERVLRSLLDDPTATPEGQPPVSSLLERGYDPGNETADAQLIVIVHDEDATESELAEAQRTIETLADEQISAETFVVGQALAFDRGGTATGESFRLIGPLMIAVVFIFLAAAYRNLLDVLLTAAGLGLVLVWTAGLTSWLGIEFTQLLVAVPCLLIGLGIDYSFHVVMRAREQPTAAADEAMTRGLAGVIVALVATTATTAIGFASGVISPIAILRDFGIVIALGVLSTLVIFGAFIPAARVELGTDSRRQQSIGSVRVVSVPLGYCGRIAERFPVIVVCLALLFAAGGAVGLSTVDASTERTDFLPEEPPEWMSNLPGPLQPTETGIRENAVFVDETFPSPTEPTAEILIQGNITHPETIDRLQSARSLANESSVSVEPRDGSPIIKGPLDAIHAATEGDEEIDRLLRDSGNETVSQGSIEWVYDAAFDAAPETANETIARDDQGAYTALRLTVTVDEDATDENVTAQMHAVADTVADSSELDVTATGAPLLAHAQEQAILDTVLRTLLLALGVIAAVLTVLFRREHGFWSLGLLTLTPVLLSIGWLVGTMALLSISYNAETALLTAIAIGLGTDYTIHITDRFVRERAESSRAVALQKTVVETGGAVLSSALTTAFAFVVLLLSVVPSLQRFGLVTGLAVVLAATASLLVLPALLVCWDRFRSRG